MYGASNVIFSETKDDFNEVPLPLLIMTKPDLPNLSLVHRTLLPPGAKCTPNLSLNSSEILISDICCIGVGCSVGFFEGKGVGSRLGDFDGRIDGLEVFASEGENDGADVGYKLGGNEGSSVGSVEGSEVGRNVDNEEGLAEGTLVR